jgi:hypothetical protein
VVVPQGDVLAGREEAGGPVVVVGDRAGDEFVVVVAQVWFVVALDARASRYFQCAVRGLLARTMTARVPLG